jgi:hypothetical protein
MSGGYFILNSAHGGWLYMEVLKKPSAVIPEVVIGSPQRLVRPGESAEEDRGENPIVSDKRRFRIACFTGMTAVKTIEFMCKKQSLRG